MKTFYKIKDELKPYNADLVIVSKNRTVEEILPFYTDGHRMFGENRVQELNWKKEALPDDIVWHMIGHLQTNKVRQVLPLANMIQSIDSGRLYHELVQRIQPLEKSIDILLQVFVASDETKFGFEPQELNCWLETEFKSNNQIKIRGVMGMATLTEDETHISRDFTAIRQSFETLKNEYFTYPEFNICSMGMSSDYMIALECGSTMVRIGSKLFE